MNASPPFDFDAEVEEVEAPPAATAPPKKPRTPKKELDLSEVLEAAIRSVLKDKETKPSDRVKAIEAGAKLLAIRHKIEGGGDAGNFFAK